MAEAARREQLTQSARTAAEEGKWDIVRDCYQRRAQALADEPVAADEAERLLSIDREIQARVRLAQTALKSLMRDTAAIRQRLRGLRLGQGSASADSGTILLQA